MPRPRKWRKVCCLPGSTRFGPLNSPFKSDHFIKMTVDEYETIRLIDLEGFTQESCADQMHIARTTVQRIYNDARKKLAECLVYGKILHIEGGDVEICDGLEETCECGGCVKHRVGRGAVENNCKRGVRTLSGSDQPRQPKADDMTNKEEKML